MSAFQRNPGDDIHCVIVTRSRFAISLSAQPGSRVLVALTVTLTMLMDFFTPGLRPGGAYTAATV
jgi:hypothetical protein